MTQKYNKTLGTNQHRDFKTTWITSLDQVENSFLVDGTWWNQGDQIRGPKVDAPAFCCYKLYGKVRSLTELLSEIICFQTSMCMYYVCMSYQHIIENTQIQEVICLARFLGIESWQFWIFPFKTNMIWSLIIASTQVSSKPLTIRTNHDYMISFSFLDLCSFKSQHERNARQICNNWLITIANLQHRS